MEQYATLSNMVTTSQGLSKFKLSNINNLVPQSYCHISNAQYTHGYHIRRTDIEISIITENSLDTSGRAQKHTHTYTDTWFTTKMAPQSCKDGTAFSKWLVACAIGYLYRNKWTSASSTSHIKLKYIQSRLQLYKR